MKAVFWQEDRAAEHIDNIHRCQTIKRGYALNSTDHYIWCSGLRSIDVCLFRVANFSIDWLNKLQQLPPFKEAI